MEFETKQLGEYPDYIAPDGSQIRLLPDMKVANMAHCTLDVGETSQAVAHYKVVEIWYFLSGKGQMWRKQNGRELVVDVHAGVSLTIPAETHFQFRNSGNSPLQFIIVTIPAWPGPQEARKVKNYWSLDD